MVGRSSCEPRNARSTTNIVTGRVDSGHLRDGILVYFPRTSRAFKLRGHPKVDHRSSTLLNTENSMQTKHGREDRRCKYTSLDRIEKHREMLGFKPTVESMVVKLVMPFNVDRESFAFDNG